MLIKQFRTGALNNEKLSSKNNKALGQCAITSILIHDLFGGRMIYDKANFHIWNEFPDGTQHDFSRSQFTDKRIFSIYKYKTRDDILFDERGIKTNLEKRYKLLKKLYLQSSGIISVHEI